jgi:ABC-type thiamin/hydroxymethylpyrimidine transport system permease subunit
MREAKFRQAAFVYLHVAILYEAAAYVMWREGLLPTRFGPPWLWLLIAAGFTAGVVWGLLRYRKPWFARTIWAVHGLRLPALIHGAFFAGESARVVPGFYLTAIVLVTINLWMLARAGWDL